jgi:hypothetical protein
VTRLLLAATVSLVAWGALAFGAVYPWAWKPLIGGCAAVGVASIMAARSRGGRADDHWLLVALLVAATAAVVQIVPLPRDVRLAVSPASEPFLVQSDLEYAVAVATQDSAEATDAVPARALSIHPPATVRGIVLLIGLVVWLAGLTRLLAVTGSRRLATPVVAFGVLLALIAIIQYAVLGDHAYLGMKIYGFWAPRNKLTTPFGPFVNKNHFAGWMLMGLPLAIGLGLGWFERGMGGAQHGWRALLRWASSPEGGKAQIALLAATLMGVALLMARSRSGIIGFVVALLLTTGVVSRRFGGARTRLTAFGVLAVVLIAAFGAAQVNLADRFTTGGASIELRRHIWRDAASVIRDFPVAGTGLNTFSAAMTRYQTPPRDAHFQEAHNDYLQVAVEGGLLLAVPSAAALVLLVLAIRRRFASGHDDGMSYWLRVGATTGLVAIALQSLVEFSLQMPGNAVMAATLMAIALHEAPRRVAVPVREPARPHRRRATA